MEDELTIGGKQLPLHRHMGLIAGVRTGKGVSKVLLGCEGRSAPLPRSPIYNASQMKAG